MKPITLSKFWAGTTAYFAHGSDGWQYLVSYDRWNAEELRTKLRCACDDQTPVTVRYLEGERCRWVRDVVPVSAVSEEARPA